MRISEVIEKLGAVAKFVPEYGGEGDYREFKGRMDELLAKHPPLTRYTEYLEFLRLTGGAGVDHPEFSLAIYGFGGYAVASFDEPRLFLNQDRYFSFADVYYPSRPEPILVFAFDFQSEEDVVHIAADEVWEYQPCCGSFKQLLTNFANGKYPKLNP